MNNTTIKKKTIQFFNNHNYFTVLVKYDTSPFGEGSPSFWQSRLVQADKERLNNPLTYQHTQIKNWQLQIPEYKTHRFYCSARRKDIENQTNILPLVKEQVLYQWHNRKAIEKYEKQVSNFNYLIEEKYKPLLVELKEQKKELKQKLKGGKIDNIEYQRLYTPIRKKIEKVEFKIWRKCRNFRDRYFERSRLKEIYRD